ncbi:unnamed protein product [Adineta steineri]|uniref:F-box domain-containing protein n=1 Tax=Adineta steineri TaxID=433720 RepID=A0A814EU10_9BILA|nr:unnamed protein product [Adineta steineri]CAF1098041.1 unnamed protein product [Adineta steineri]CAF1295739.1 unnamed protein product [Adineta steineri]
MEYSSLQLNDLPDEILMIIFKKLDNITLLYSLIGDNIRLNRIVCDSIFTNRLTLVNFVPQHLITARPLLMYLPNPLSDPMLDRFCLQILPKIHEKVKRLDLELLSMERILRCTNYPNLSQITLYNIEIERALQLFSDESLFISTYKNQISLFVIDIRSNGERDTITDENPLLFTYIFNTFTNLQILDIGPYSIWYQYLSFDISPPNAISSTLLELHVNLNNFSDCLYLLDGRFKQLCIFHADIERITSNLVNNNKEKLPNLRSFKLYCDSQTKCYDELILPLLHRMSNLEKLDLSLDVSTTKTFVDGNNLKLNIINHMSLLNEFKFNICSSTRFYNQFNLPSNEFVQQMFKDFQNKQIISSVDYFNERGYSRCHIYSYPYELRYYEHIANSFPGGIFKRVRTISLFDERPFEHEFFFQIAQSFPCLEKLTVINKKRQNNKQFGKSKNQNQDSAIIEYSYLVQLDLSEAHKDYHEQFLFDTKTCLPNNVRVEMDYRLVKKVTRNFRRNTTRSNCAKISLICFYKKSTFPEHLKDYFPYAKII